MKNSKKITTSLILLVLFGFIFYSQSGYSISVKGAIKKSYPNDNGTILFEQSDNNYKIVFLEGEHNTYAKLLHRKWRFFYQVKSTSTLSSVYPDETIKRTWDAHFNSNKKYDTMLAVEITDPEVVKIIISNEDIDGEYVNNLEELKETSNIYLELNVNQGYATTYIELEPKDAGAFVFRGLDTDGNIKYVGR